MTLTPSLTPEEWVARAQTFWADFPPDAKQRFPVFIVQRWVGTQNFWVIQDAAYLLNRELFWERRVHDDDGLQAERTRFETPDEALTVYQQWRAIDVLPLVKTNSQEEKGRQPNEI